MLDLMTAALLAPTEGKELSLWDAVLKSGPVAKFVLVLLMVFSILSWVVIVRKFVLYRRSKQASDAFRNVFKRASDWRELKQQAERFSISPLLGMFVAGYNEVTYQLRANSEGRAQLRRMEAVERSLQRASVVEMGRLEASLGLLATVAAVSPFVGLFGTVWGIIDAFRSIGATGNANLATVAPGIAEALVATAVGLIAAIPALMAYNFFQGQLKQWQTELDDFALEFISLSERNFT
jgi:biopolymer transport protein TolQ